MNLSLLIFFLKRRVLLPRKDKLNSRFFIDHVLLRKKIQSKKYRRKHLLGLQVLDGGGDRGSGRGGELPAPTSVHPSARLAGPDTGSLSLDGGLTAVRAKVLSALGQLDTLDQLTESGTISGSESASDANFLRAASHFV